MLETFWAKARKAGTKPKNIEYSAALVKSLEAAGFSLSEAAALAQRAAAQRREAPYNLADNDVVPRVPEEITGVEVLND